MPKKQWDRDGIRARVMAIMDANGWSLDEASKYFKVSDSTLDRLCKNKDRWQGLADATTQRLVHHLEQLESGGIDEPVIVQPEAPEPEPTLPVSRSTDMLTSRHVDGQEVFTYRDIAAGFQVDEAVVRQAYNNNQDNWGPGETGVSKLSTPSGVQEVRWFPPAGALNFCRHVFSGRSNQIFKHIRDYWLAGQQKPGDTSASAILAEVMKAFAGQLGGQFNAVQQELTQVKAIAEQAKQATEAIDVQAIKSDVEVAATEAKRREDRRKQAAIGSLATWVEKLVALRIRLGIHANTKVGRQSAYATVNGGINGRYGVAGRSYLDADQAEDAVNFIKAEYHKALNGHGQRVIDFPGA